MPAKLLRTAIALALVSGTLTAMAQDPAASAAAMDTDAKATAQPAAATAIRKGMTWGVYPSDVITGTATVSCQGAPALPSPNQAGCNATNGDTDGRMRLPVLCFRPLGLPYPVPNPTAPAVAGYWSGGLIATTPAVSPVAMGWVGKPSAVVSAYCQSQFGTGWQVAEFHLGQNKGWKFGAFGNTGKPGKERFWVHINDQPNGNVWNLP